MPRQLRHPGSLRSLRLLKKSNWLTIDTGALNTTANLPGSTSKTMSIASFQNGTIEFNPVRLKSSSMKSSATSQKYSCPGKEQNQDIHVKVDVGVDEAKRPREERVEADIDGVS